MSETASLDEKLPCGGIARVDPESSFYASVCMTCLCVVGSIGMPEDCRAMMYDAERSIRAGMPRG